MQQCPPAHQQALMSASRNFWSEAHPMLHWLQSSLHCQELLDSHPSSPATEAQVNLHNNICWPDWTSAMIYDFLQLDA